jgi:hypothetical protein
MGRGAAVHATYGAARFTELAGVSGQSSAIHAAFSLTRWTSLGSFPRVHKSVS